MRQSHGAIGVQSAEGAGSCFTLYLPRVRATAASVGADAPSSHDQAPLGRGETILLVEDEMMVRQVARRMLEAEGYSVLTAPDAVSARSIFERQGATIALMVTDVMMPGESGIELAAFLRQQRPELAVIFISGYSDTELPDRDGRPGADDFVQKPFTSSQLLSRVDARLRGANRPSPIDAHSR
jgi:DNA-binding response OmpR family regulator